MVKATLPSRTLHGGLSQQPQALRLPGQAEFTSNALGTVVGGLTKRPPSSHDGTFNGVDNYKVSGIKHHTIRRGSSELYHVMRSGAGGQAGELKIFNMLDSDRVEDGMDAIDVLKPDGSAVDATALAYLSTADPENDLEFLTVADYTLVLNKSKTAALTADVTKRYGYAAASNGRPFEGIALLKQGNYNAKYTIKVEWVSGGATHVVETHYTTHSSRGTRGNPLLPTTTSPKNDKKITTTGRPAWEDAVNEAEFSIRTDEIIDGLVYGLTHAPITSGDHEDCFGTTEDEYLWNAHTGVRTTSTHLDTDPSGGAYWEVFGESGVIHIIRHDTSPTIDFVISVEDSIGGEALIAIKDSVTSFSELPLYAPNGMKVEVNGDPETLDSGYWLEFATKTAKLNTGGPDPITPTRGEGVWNETNAPGVTYKLDPTTLPHALIRLSTGKFCWTPLDGATITPGGATAVTVPAWGERIVGDTITNRDPSFVGKKIQTMVFWKDRLGLTSGADCIFSESGEFFNFFKTTGLDLLDTARIDISVPSNDVVVLNHAVPLSESLVLFSDNAQFMIQGGQVFTPTSVVVSEVSNYSVPPGSKPIAHNNYVLASSTRGDHSSIYEIRDVSQDKPQLQALDITRAVPSWIPKDVGEITSSENESLIAVIPKAPRSAYKGNTDIYLYSYFINGDERVHSAWQEIQFFAVCNVRHIYFKESKLYVVVERADSTGGYYEMNLEVIDFTPFSTENPVEAAAARGSHYLLDRQCALTDCTTAYDAATDVTTITLPYRSSVGPDIYLIAELDEDIRIVAKPTAYSLGGSRNQITMSGDFHTINKAAAIVGESYQMRHVFSQPTIQDDRGGPLANDNLRLHAGNLIYADTSHFTIEVLRKDADERFDSTILSSDIISTAEFTGLEIGGGAKISNEVRDSGVFRFGVMANARDVHVSVKNNLPWPCRFVSIDWDVNYSLKGQRL